MITNFNLFESIDMSIDLPEDVLNNLTNALTFIIYKGTKRNVQKHKNYKSLRIKKIDGYCNDNTLRHKEMTTECLFKIEMTNKDKIEAKYTRKVDLEQTLENSVYIEINGDKIYHLDDDKYETNSFIQKIGIEYQKYIENKKWKIK